MANEFARNIADNNKLVTKALPAANATATSDDIDLQTGGVFPENVSLEISVPATAAHTAGVFTFSLQNAATATPTTALLNQSFTVASSTAGGAATTKRFALASDVLQYLNVKCVSSTATDGDSTGISYTVKLLF